MSAITTRNSLRSGTIEDKEKEILSREPLLAFHQFQLSEDDDNVEDFVYNIMVAYKDKYQTVKVLKVNSSTGRNTDGTIYSTTGRHRSLVDLFLLCKYYFPECTLKQVIKGLYYLHSINKLGSQICSTVNRRVYECKIKYPAWQYSNQTSIDELGYKEEDYINIFNNNN